jgi:hypothetical protein
MDGQDGHRNLEGKESREKLTIGDTRTTWSRSLSTQGAGYWQTSVSEVLSPDAINPTRARALRF